MKNLNVKLSKYYLIFFFVVDLNICIVFVLVLLNILKE